MFKTAVKQEAKLRLAIAGPSGSGKTYTALAIASNLGKKVALVDTEHGSASKYADIFQFDVMEMEPPFNPDRFCKAIIEAQAGGYDVIVLDSLSHAWNGTGGLLELVDQFALKYKGNTYAGWKEGTPVYNKLIDTIVQSNIHVIATMRSKQDYVLEVGSDGKQHPKKVGMAPIQRDGFEYEFDVFLEMDIDNIGRIIKTRCPALTGKAFKLPGADVAGILTDWLKGAARVETTDVLSKNAMDWAAKEWNIAPKEAREKIEQALKDGKLEANMPKDGFKKFVKGM
jgi:ABC-type dipeptide/oligopeptide/nickel transport system ATPase component